jgi:hypothetical protein
VAVQGVFRYHPAGEFAVQLLSGFACRAATSTWCRSRGVEGALGGDLQIVANLGDEQIKVG